MRLLDNSLRNQINLLLLQEEEFKLCKLVDEVKVQLKESDLLIPGCCIPPDSGTTTDIAQKRASTYGNFEDSVWILQHDLSQIFTYIDFSKLEELKFKGIDNDSILLIKCFIGESLIYNKYDEDNELYCRSANHISSMYNRLVDFIDKSSFFNKYFLDTSKGSYLREFFDSLSDTAQYRVKIFLFDLFEYLEDKVSDEFLETLSQYRKEIDLLNINYQKSKARKLPRSGDFLLFSNYLDIFYKDESISKTLKLYFMPLLLWWKITSIIPMRPSEFCTKIIRNCLLNEDGNYFLKIDRVKKKSNLNRKLLPILPMVKITKEIHDLIEDYILKTNEYGNSYTLISYRAIAGLREKMVNTRSWLYVNFAINSTRRKYDQDRFSIEILNTLIDRFYRDIINSYYKDIYIKEKIKLGDTRHLAFTSLMLQGLSPIEIAIIGGHRTLSAFDNYTCSVNSYVDIEVINIIKKNVKIESYGYGNLIDVFENMPKECPVPIENCVEAAIDDEEVGYCTIIKNNPNSCYRDDCIDCPHWWCKPTQFNFIRLEKILRKRLNDKNNKLNRNLEFLKTLFKETGLDVIDGKLVVDNSVAKELRRLSLELDSNTRDVIDLKVKMLNPALGELALLSDIEELLPTKQVNNFIDENIIITQKKWNEKLLINDDKATDK